MFLMSATDPTQATARRLDHVFDLDSGVGSQLEVVLDERPPGREVGVVVHRLERQQDVVDRRLEGVELLAVATVGGLLEATHAGEVVLDDLGRLPVADVRRGVNRLRLGTNVQELAERRAQ